MPPADASGEAKDRRLPHLWVSTTPTHEDQRSNSKTGFSIRPGVGLWIVTHPSQEPVFKFLLIGMLFPAPSPKVPGEGQEMEGYGNILSLLQGFSGERPTPWTGGDMLIPPHPYTAVHRPS